MAQPSSLVTKRSGGTQQTGSSTLSEGSLKLCLASTKLPGGSGAWQLPGSAGWMLEGHSSWDGPW